MAGWYQHLLDAELAFMYGRFEHPDKHKMYTKVPEAYKKWYPSWAIFQLLRTQGRSEIGIFPQLKLIS